MLYQFYFHFLACGGDKISLGGICCEENQVNDNGQCENECSDDRPVENAGVCGCAAGLEDLGNGACCNLAKTRKGTNGDKGKCAQQLLRDESVKEFCQVDFNQAGICHPSTDCDTVAKPKRGSCSKDSHVCCFLPAPGIDDATVNKTLEMADVSTFRTTICCLWILCIVF